MLTKEQKMRMAEAYADRFYDRKSQNSLWRDRYFAYFAGLEDANVIFSVDIKLLKNAVVYLREKLYLEKK